MTDIARLGIEVDSRRVRTASDDLGRFNRQAVRTEKSATGVERAAQRMGASMRAAAAGFAAAAASAASIAQIGRSVEQYTRMTNAMRSMGLSAEDASNAIDQIAGVAQRTRAPLESTAQLYQRISIAGSELGASQQDILRFTENVGLALAQTGGSASEASGALMQLSQAMGSGVVRAEEFNSILEGAYPIALAAAKGIEEAGGSVAKLRSLMLEGEITSQEFFRAILSQTDELEAAFANTVPTMAQALGRLSDSFTMLIGKMNSTVGASAGIANVMILIANNLDRVISYAGAAAVALGVRYGGAAALAAARNITLAGTFRVLRGALISTGIGAAVVMAGELALWFGRLTAATGSWGQALSLMKNVAQEAFERIYSLVSGIGKHFDATALSIKATMADAMAGAIDSAGEFGNKIAGVAVGSKDAFIAAFKALPGALGDLVFQSANAVVRGVEAMINGVVDRVNVFIDFANDALAGVAGFFGLGDIGIGRLGGVNLGEIKNAYDGAATAAGESVAAAFGAAMDREYISVTGDALRKVADGARAGAQSARDMGSAMIQDAKGPLDSLQALRAALKSTADETAGASTAVADLEAALNGLGSGAGGAGGGSGGGGSGSGKGGGSGASGGKGAKGALDEIAEAATNAGTAIRDALIQAMDEAKQKTQEVADQIKGSFTDAFKGVVTGATSMGDAVSGILSKLADMLLTNAGNALFGGIAARMAPAFMPIPAFASGTNYAPGGLALVGEEGPEVVNLRRGSQVIPNHKLPGMGAQRVKVELVGGDLVLSDSGQIITTVSAKIDQSSAATERRTLAKTPGYLDEQRMRAGLG